MRSYEKSESFFTFLLFACSVDVSHTLQALAHVDVLTGALGQRTRHATSCGSEVRLNKVFKLGPPIPNTRYTESFSSFFVSCFAYLTFVCSQGNPLPVFVPVLLFSFFSPTFVFCSCMSSSLVLF